MCRCVHLYWVGKPHRAGAPIDLCWNQPVFIGVPIPVRFSYHSNPSLLSPSVSPTNRSLTIAGGRRRCRRGSRRPTGGPCRDVRVTIKAGKDRIHSGAAPIDVGKEGLCPGLHCVWKSPPEASQGRIDGGLQGPILYPHGGVPPT